MRPKGSAGELAARRKAAGMMFDDGFNPSEVSKTLGVAYSTAWQWHKAWKEVGMAGLEPKPRPPCERRLTPKQLEQLRDAIVAGASKAGFPDDTWTCPRVQKWIKKTFGVDYHVDHLSKLLRALDLTPQLPKRQAKERDTAAVERFRQRVWPRVKKGRTTAS